MAVHCETLIWNPGWNRTRNVVYNSRIETDIRVHALSVTKSRIFSLLWVKQHRASDQSRRKKSSFAGFLERFEKTSKRWQAAHLHLRETFETFYILLIYCFFQGSSILKFERWYRFYVADQDTARYSLCSATENCVSWAEPLKCSFDQICLLKNIIISVKFRFTRSQRTMFSCTQHVVFLKNISGSDTGFGYLSRLSMI